MWSTRKNIRLETMCLHRTNFIQTLKNFSFFCAIQVILEDIKLSNNISTSLNSRKASYRSTKAPKRGFWLCTGGVCWKVRKCNRRSTCNLFFVYNEHLTSSEKGYKTEKSWRSLNPKPWKYRPCQLCGLDIDI